jgi:hypothetical protein
MLVKRACLILNLYLLVSLWAAVGLSCKSTFYDPPPDIPIEYYQCQSVPAGDLVKAYYSRYQENAVARATFNDHIFVLKNIELTDKESAHLHSEGFIWVDMIKCFVTNTAYCARFKTGDKIDLVGVNHGDTLEFMGLIFLDCYILPAGSLPLPAPEIGGAAVLGY